MKSIGTGILRYAFFAVIVCSCVLLFKAAGGSVFRFSDTTFWKPVIDRFSPEFDKVTGRLVEISEELNELPVPPPPTGGGTTGYLSDSKPGAKDRPWVAFSFDEPRSIDAVACVPAQQPRNFHSNEALSSAGRMEIVLELKGREIRRIRFEVPNEARNQRTTLPYFSEFEPLEIDRVRIEHVRSPDEDINFAIGEFFIFSGNVSMSHEARISASSSRQGVPGVDIDYISDDQTALGLSEIREPHRYVGYRSLPKSAAEFTITIQLDWTEPQRIDEVRLYPVGRLLGASTDAAGFPPMVELEYWSAGRNEWIALSEKSGEAMESPGWNPVALRFPQVETDRIRLVFDELWKATKRSAAILALSEIEPRLEGVRVAAAEPSVSDPPHDGEAAPDTDGTARFWGLAGLTDGMTSDGRIMAERDWLRGLARRADLLIEQANQLRRKDSLEAVVNRRFSGVAMVLILLFFASLLWLVIHQQSKHRREVRGIRNRLAADLHDDLGSNLSTISIYVQRLRRQLDPTPECIDPMQRLIRESVGSLKEMVSFTTPQISRSISLVERLKEIADIHCAEMLHEFQVEPGLETISVSSSHRRSLRLFLKEAIHNAMRHSGADRINLNIWRDETRDIWLSIRDNGKGLPSEVLAKESSLPTLRLRAEEMNARFSVSNPPDGGCEIAVRIRPLSLIPGPLE